MCARRPGLYLLWLSDILFSQCPPLRRGGSWIEREAVSGPCRVQMGPAESPETQVLVCTPSSAGRLPGGCVSDGPRSWEWPHCILSGCSCGGWYCTKVVPAGAAAERAGGMAAG